MASRIACPSCGAFSMDRFCGECGEKRLSHHDLSLRHYLGELLETSTHLDSNILRSFWELVRHPGGLSVSYFTGRRVRFVAPVRLFVLFSVVYFFVSSLWPNPAFTTPLAIQLHGNDFYPALAATQVSKVLLHKGWDYPTLERLYDAKTAVLSKTILFVLIPVFALLFAAFMARRRRYFSEHLVVATHFWSYALLLIGVLIPLLLATLSAVGPQLGVSAAFLTSDAVPTLVLQLSFAVYLYLMLRRVYGVSWWYGGLVACTIAWSFFFMVWLFRFLLFFVTLNML